MSWIWIFYWVFVGLVALSVAVIAHYDRVAVFLMKRTHFHACPVAIGIAMLITERPEQWSASTHHMSHPDIGSI